MKYSILFPLFSVLVLCGCGSGVPLPDDLPRLVPCKLTFTQENEPLAAATVFLQPLDEDNRWFPGGQTDERGTVDLFSNGRYRGAPAGRYKIIVTKNESDASKLPPSPDEGDPGYEEWLKKVEKETLPTYSLVEKRYSAASSTPLEIEIGDEKNIEKSFEVGKKVRVRL